MDMSNPIYHDNKKAREHLESLRWPDGPWCPHCGDTESCVRVKGKSARPGLHYCNSCKGQFTVTVGTLFERSKVPLSKWLLAFHLMAASKKGVSAHQLHRMLGVTYKTAWFMAHRIREAMREKADEPLGGASKTVEADETFIGGKAKGKGKKGGYTHKEAVVSLVERGGKVRSVHVPKVNASTLKPVLYTQIDRASRLSTDQAKHYKTAGQQFASHISVDHSIKEYVRGDAHTNTLEGYFAILKRGIGGVYQHVSGTHLKRYLGEFDFRYNTRQMSDFERADLALQGIEGKRLTYRRTTGGARPSAH